MRQTKRYNYVVGDVQGCFNALTALLEKIKFDENQDFLWFAGDLVARGENSLATLRFIRSLCEKGCAKTVLGNHDLTLIACARGLRKAKKKDNIQAILDAPDVDELIDWLRIQPLCLMPNEHTVLTHAGVPSIWSIQKTMQLAQEVGAVLSDLNWAIVDEFLSQMYANEPDIWCNTLSGMARLRVIVNYLTRMRLATEHGQLEFSFKEDLNTPMPEGFAPWFSFDSQVAKNHQILFGHWAALKGNKVAPNIQNIDGGCVWGGALIAYCLETQQATSVM